MSDATTVITALDALVKDIAGDKLSAAAQAKLALYSGIVGSLLNEALPVINSKINWAAIETGVAQALAGIEATYDAIEGKAATDQADVASPTV
ncbi:hypothetical protein [Tanticharoenia sakaeratensis]|uniref:Uncharacterized protein n=1 Tax=Tanticharoenia sakaeratensis NBRC 103193 TaxID=1231623 RepID=A0A0D6MMJ7_9PROT|nr:hypothetical protein [Tanticharoenia sakaeratensis]GAN54894.1 hypothetical protein Tasa_033_008 [Tanticharoenia sakaeratensis NBRC 103193]GBQ23468.1 hypothetical protein AA103193_2426 [Tanticharoenia sakaeratensis NBRC 103193]